MPQFLQDTFLLALLGFCALLVVATVILLKRRSRINKMLTQVGSISSTILLLCKKIKSDTRTAQWYTKTILDNHYGELNFAQLEAIHKVNRAASSADKNAAKLLERVEQEIRKYWHGEVPVIEAEEAEPKEDQGIGTGAAVMAKPTPVMPPVPMQPPAPPAVKFPGPPRPMQPAPGTPVNTGWGQSPGGAVPPMKPIPGVPTMQPPARVVPPAPVPPRPMPGKPLQPPVPMTPPQWAPPPLPPQPGVIPPAAPAFSQTPAGVRPPMPPIQSPRPPVPPMPPMQPPRPPAGYVPQPQQYQAYPQSPAQPPQWTPPAPPRMPPPAPPAGPQPISGDIPPMEP